MIVDGAGLHAARKALGLSCNELAAALRLSGDKGGQAVREMESGRRSLTGPIAVAVELMLLELERRRA